VILFDLIFQGLAIAMVGHMSRAMLELYSHIRRQAKRDATAGLTPSVGDVLRAVANGVRTKVPTVRRCGVLMLSRKRLQSIDLIGEPGGSRTRDPLIKSQMLYH
jgi:hypothetical protein